MDHDPETIEAAIADLRRQLREWGWDAFPRDRSTVPYEDSMWAGLQNYAKAKYGEADPSLKAAIKKHFDRLDGYRKFTAFDEKGADSAE